MSRFAHVICLVLVSACSAGAPAAEKQRVARVGYAPGTLAVLGDTAEAWRVLNQGDALPEDCRLRTAAGEPCLVELPGGTLHVGPETRLQLKTRQRLAVLESGKIS